MYPGKFERIDSHQYWSVYQLAISVALIEKATAIPAHPREEGNKVWFFFRSAMQSPMVQKYVQTVIEDSFCAIPDIWTKADSVCVF